MNSGQSEERYDRTEQERMKKLFIIPMTVMTLAMSVSPAFAMDSSRSAVRTQERMEEREERTAQRCEVLDARAKLIIGRYNENFPRHVENHKKVAAGLQTLIASLKADGKDTSKLEAVLTTFNQKVSTFGQQSTAVVDQLKVAQQYACGQSQGQYATEIKKAHDLAVTAHATLLDLRSYYQNSVRPEIKALRAQ